MTLVKDFKIGLSGALHAAAVQFDHDTAGLARIFDGVVAEIPKDLAQMTGIHSYLESLFDPRNRELALLKFQCSRKFLRKVLEPGLELESLRAARLAA